MKNFLLEPGYGGLVRDLAIINEACDSDSESDSDSETGSEIDSHDATQCEFYCVQTLQDLIMACSGLLSLTIHINCAPSPSFELRLPPLSSTSSVHLSGRHWHLYLPAVSRAGKLREVSMDFAGKWLSRT